MKLKKITAAMLMAAMTMSLAACGSKGETKNNSSAEADETRGKNSDFDRNLGFFGRILSGHDSQ